MDGWEVCSVVGFRLVDALVLRKKGDDEGRKSVSNKTGWLGWMAVVVGQRKPLIHRSQVSSLLLVYPPKLYSQTECAG